MYKKQCDICLIAIIKEFNEYQEEWLTSHNDIEFIPEEEKLIIGFLKDTAESFIKEFVE